MQDLFEILQESGVEVPEDKKDSLRQNFHKSYKAVAEFDKRVNALNEQLNETITELKTKTGDIDVLNQKIADYEQKEKDRAAAEEKLNETQAHKVRFDALKGERSFLNEGTESWMFTEFEKAIADKNNAGKGDAEIFESITKDKNIFTSKNEKFTNPSARHSTQQTSDEVYLTEYYKNNPFFKK